MDWGNGASGQKTLSPRPYSIPSPHLPSGMQVRGFKHNPRTCPNWTLDPCQGRGLPTRLGRVPKDQWTPRPSHSSLLCTCVGRSQLPPELEIWSRQCPLGVWV